MINNVLIYVYFNMLYWYLFFPEYIQEKTHTPSLANQKSRQCKSALQRSLTSHWSEGPSWKSGKTRNAGQAMGKREPCYADGRDVNWQRPLWRSVWCFLKHLKNRATEHMALPLMGVYLRKTINRQDTGTPKFRVTLFTKT